MTPRGRLLLVLTGVIVFLGIWEAVPRLSLVGPALLPPPSAIVPTFWREMGLQNDQVCLDQVAFGLSIKLEQKEDILVGGGF